MMAAPSTISVALSGSLGSFGTDVAFDAPMRGITALFGPSGSGKTTILRCIAGLQFLPGRIIIGDETWQDSAQNLFLPPHRRHLGYVFQEASLFSHLSVRDNLLYGARRIGTASPSDISLDDIVKLLGIGHLLDRNTLALSGGERQRVAVGRALLSAPRVLLMDEPLSALDRATKDEILPYLEALRNNLAIPILYVSHDMAEIERLADRLVLLDRGRVTAVGRLSAMQTDTRLPFVTARDAAVTLEGSLAGFDTHYGLTQFAVDGGVLIVPGQHGIVGNVRRLRVAASDVSFTRTRATDTTILNCLPARIVAVDASDKPQANVVAALGADGGGARILARITRKSLEALALAPGSQVIAQIKSVALVA